jgi:hypothetical protein
MRWPENLRLLVLTNNNFCVTISTRVDNSGRQLEVVLIYSNTDTHPHLFRNRQNLFLLIKRQEQEIAPPPGSLK